MADVEQNGGTRNLTFGEARARAGFRVAAASGLAGGPIELEFFAEIVGGGMRYLFVTADRARYRPGDFSFAATFDAKPLSDPFADVPDLGGPAGVVEIAAGRPWHQPLVLNQFVRLEDTLDLLAPGASGRLVIDCRRLLWLAADEDAALAPATDAPLVEVRLALELRRDDAQLAALVERFVAEVRDGPPEQRERPLKLLLSLRAPLAVERWRTLVDHPDPVVAGRVRQSLPSGGR
ncbi:MAG: hypothetical protein QOF61_2485 [Acidobacteriota bacterium]|nr:hypothetical protein [Acidobacteriota bacterium]